MIPTSRLDTHAVRTALAGLSDAEVVRRVLAGEPALFEVLMRRYNQRVYRAVRSLLRDDHEVEDAMQQAWLSAFSHLDQFQGASAFSTWLTRIALNEGLARIRHKTRLAPADEPAEEDDEVMRSPLHDPEQRAADRELGRMVEQAVDALPDRYRSVFMLREIEGMSTADAATALGVSEEVVKVRLHRARLALRDLLYERAGSASQNAFTFLGWRCDRMVANVLGRILAPPSSPAA
jgi:RNA polymerase sigma-70 factor (ECF subfamily)